MRACCLLLVFTCKDFLLFFFFCSAINAKLLSEEHKICHISAYFVYFKSINSFKTNRLFFFKKQKQDKN